MKYGKKMSDESTLQDLNFAPIKFEAFPLIAGQNVEEKIVEATNESRVTLVELFRAEGFAVNAGKIKDVKV